MKIAIFGYGSLVNSKSLQETLGRLPSSQPAVLKGWRRDWSAVLENLSTRSHYVLADGSIPKNVAVLNIRLSKGSTVNGILINCEQKDIDSLIAREIHYSIVDVTDDIDDALGYDIIYSFTAKPVFTNPGNSDVIIPKSYVDLVEAGFKDIGDAQLEAYTKTTITPIHRVKDTKFVNPA